jgi:Ca-activated chloride channel family protein
VLGLLLAASPASAQDTGRGDRSVLIILDGSDSMNEPAGDGRTRLEAAKSALGELIGAVPEGAQVGLRVYGSEVSNVTRAEGCKDTKLVSPVGPLDRDAFKAKVDALEGKGRTPIGRSLLKAPEDLGGSGQRTVVLISDGGDNCAPPPPCRAAAKVAKRGVDLSISVVGLQVNERVRKQLACIADAGGGTYVDANDPEALRRELLAAFARAFRSYDPTGTPVQGADAPESAPVIGEGQYLEALRPGDEKYYAVDVKPGEKLYTSATAIPPRGLDGDGVFAARLITPKGGELSEEREVLDYDFLGQYGNITALAMRGDQTAAPGVASESPPGRWIVRVAIEPGRLEPKPVPVELGVQVLDPNESPGTAVAPGKAGTTPTPAASATPTPKPKAADESSSAVVPVTGVVTLLAGLFGGFMAARRRRA